ncbi:MAG TPA: hypothetical protein VKN14_15630, partial [Flavobacteriaceae bacterium]|nr:hypothetical protein [Flavobacteriaceae bacterium]
MYKELYLELKGIVLQKDFSFFVFILSLFLLPLSINFSTFTIILAFVLKIIQVIFAKKKIFATRALKNSALLGILFFVYIILDSIFQIGFLTTLALFNKQYSHFALLFIAPILLKDKQQNKLLLYSFSLGSITAIVCVFFITIINDMTFNRDSFLKYLDIHHTYIAIFLLFILNQIFIKLIYFKRRLNNLNWIRISITALGIIAVIYALESKVSLVI